MNLEEIINELDSENDYLRIKSQSESVDPTKATIKGHCLCFAKIPLKYSLICDYTAPNFALRFLKFSRILAKLSVGYLSCIHVVNQIYSGIRLVD